jgi:hypothetical protein
VTLIPCCKRLSVGGVELYKKEDMKKGEDAEDLSCSYEDPVLQTLASIKSQVSSVLHHLQTARESAQGPIYSD